MDTTMAHEHEGSAYQLPPEIREIRDVARRIVRTELLPLEQDYMASAQHA